MDELGIIVNYCSNELPFLDTLLDNATAITPEVVVSYGNKLYDGSPEDLRDIRYFKYKYPTVQFVEYEVDLNIRNPKGVEYRPTAYYHNLARCTAVHSLSSHVAWVLVLDADEIPDGDRFSQWFRSVQLNENYAYKLSTYWYFKEVQFRAKTWEDSILLIHKKHLTENNIFHDYERDDIIKYSGVFIRRHVLSLDDIPMFHHFSWIRGKRGLVKKLSTWAHKDELFPNNTPDEIVSYIYRDANPNDIVHNYDYDVVPNYFDIEV